MRNEITVCKKRDFALQDCKLTISITQTHCRVSDVTKPLTLSMKRRCVTDRKLFGSYVFSRDWGWFSLTHFTSQHLFLSGLVSVCRESQSPINLCTHSSMSPSFKRASDKCLCFLVPFVDPVYVCWGVNVCFHHDLLHPCESRPLHSDAFLPIRLKHQRVSAVPDLCCFILFHQQHTPLLWITPILVKHSLCSLLKHTGYFHTPMMQVLFMH